MLQIGDKQDDMEVIDFCDYNGGCFVILFKDQNKIVLFHMNHFDKTSLIDEWFTVISWKTFGKKYVQKIEGNKVSYYEK